jgi:hypothetical protein
VGLKLTGHITWSWLWVLSPLWVGFAAVVAVLLTLAVVGGIYVAVTELWPDRKIPSNRLKVPGKKRL